MAIERIIIWTTISVTTIFQIYFNQVENSILAMEMPPIRTPLVGVTALINAHAPLNTQITISGAKPNPAASGPKIGMDTVARPEVDGIKKDNNKNTIYANAVNNREDVPANASEAFSNIYISKPVVDITTEIPRETAITNATLNISAEPLIKEWTMSFSFNP